MSVLTADADSEDQAPGSELRDVGELASDQDGMPQRQQVEAGVDRQRRVQHRQCRRLDEPVESLAAKAHMVRAADMVDAGLVDPGEVVGSEIARSLEEVEGWKHAEVMGAGLCVITRA